MQYNILSLAFKVLQNSQPSYLRDLLNIQSTRNTRSAPAVTLARSSNPSLKITDRSFHLYAPLHWNKLPTTLRQHTIPSSDDPCSVFYRSFVQSYHKLKTRLLYSHTVRNLLSVAPRYLSHSTRTSIWTVCHLILSFSLSFIVTLCHQIFLSFFWYLLSVWD
jgi:hypothetical protein